MGNKIKTTLEWALEYVKRYGWPVLPCYAVKPDGQCNCPPDSDSRRHKNEDGTFTLGACKSAGKHPYAPLVPRGSHDATTDINTIRRWFANDGEYNIAIRTGQNDQGSTMVVDLDVRKEKNGPATWDALDAEIGPFGETLQQTTGSGGRQLFWWTDTEVSNSAESKLGPGIDVRGKSGYVVVPPSVNDMGEYNWENWGCDVLTAPKALEERAIVGKAAPRPVTRAAAAPGPVAVDHPHDRLTLAQVEELLKAIPAGPRDNWLALGFTLRTIADWIGGERKAFEVWDAWAQTGDAYGGPDDQEKHWRSFEGKPTEHPIGILRGKAKDHGWTPSANFQRQESTHWKSVAKEMMEALPKDAESDSEEVMALLGALGHLPELVSDEFVKKLKTLYGWRPDAVRKAIKANRRSDTADAEPSDVGLMIARRVLNSRYSGLLIRPSDRFFWKYNSRHWEPISNGDEIVGDRCIAEIEALGPIPWTVSSIKQQAVDLLHSLCAKEGDPLRLLTPPPSVINCLNGELWIQPDGTVEMRKHSPESYLRFCLNVEYDPDAKCPVFDQTVLEIFANSPEPEEMQRHLYEMYGYAIQPKRDKKQFWMWEGMGNNGKTGLADTLDKLVGEQATITIKLNKIDHEYNISALKQKILVRDNDIDFKSVLPDGIVKQLSEDAPLTGRDPYGKPTPFKNCSLLLMLCNKYPMTKDLSHGLQVRAHAIPFRRKFIEGKDLKLGLFEKIWATELPGILNRAIEGLQRLRKRHGHYLEPKDCVLAKQEFLRQANPLPRFIAEACATSQTSLEELRLRARASALREFMEEPGPETVSLPAATTLMAAMLEEDAGYMGKCIEDRLMAAMAQAEERRLRQPLTQFYHAFWTWTQNNGILMAHKPPKADVENYLINLGHAITTVNNQKWVDGVQAFEQEEERF